MQLTAPATAAAPASVTPTAWPSRPSSSACSACSSSTSSSARSPSSWPRVALWRGTTRRGRACLGLGLGVADLLVLLAFMAVRQHRVLELLS